MKLLDSILNKIDQSDPHDVLITLIVIGSGVFTLVLVLSMLSFVGFNKDCGCNDCTKPTTENAVGRRLK